jgi:hypothetical protein
MSGFPRQQDVRVRPIDSEQLAASQQIARLSAQLLDESRETTRLTKLTIKATKWLVALTVVIVVLTVAVVVLTAMVAFRH